MVSMYPLFDEHAEGLFGAIDVLAERRIWFLYEIS